MLYTLEQKPVEVDKVFNGSAATELDNTPVEESIDSNNVPHTDTNMHQVQIHPLNMNQNKVIIQDQEQIKQICLMTQFLKIHFTEVL